MRTSGRGAGPTAGAVPSRGGGPSGLRRWSRALGFGLIAAGCWLPGTSVAVPTGSRQVADVLPRHLVHPGSSIGPRPSVERTRSQSQGTSPDDIYWSRAFAQPGADSVVFATLTHGESLFIAGSFGFVGSVPARGVALRTGGVWRSIGEGLPGQVRALCWWRGSLVAGGSFTSDRGAPCDYLARFTGSQWQALAGSDLDGPVNALAMLHDTLYVAGEFVRAGADTVNMIIAWDGEVWHPLQSGLAGDGPIALALLAAGDSLIVGGRFTTAGGDTVHNVAAWRHADWGPVGGGVWHSHTTQTGGPVRDLLAWHNEILLAGSFLIAGGAAIGSLAGWDGESWTGFDGPGIKFGADLFTVTAWHDTLVIGGKFAREGTPPVYNNIARLVGTTWQSLGSGLFEQDYWQPNGICADLTVVGDSLLVSGNFELAGSRGFPNLAWWANENWGPVTVGAGLDFDGYALCVHDSTLYCGGAFNTSGGQLTNFVAAWHDSMWTPVGNGFNSLVYTALDATDSLIVGGYFTQSGTVAVPYLASWKGVSWASLGGGTDGNVMALARYDGQIIAGGTFTLAGGVPARNIAAWDGTAWSPLGQGLDGAVWAAAVWNGALIVGGTFAVAGSAPASCIARWDGSTWSALGTGFAFPGGSAIVYSLCVYNGLLIAGGQFTVADGKTVSHLAAWDGATWQDVGGGIAGGNSVFGASVRGALARQGRLVVCGAFDTAGSMAVANIAEWDGTGWNSLGTGLTLDGYWRGAVVGLATFGGHLWVGGNFSYAGGIPAGYIAEWTKLDSTTAVEHNGREDLGAAEFGAPVLQVRRRASGVEVVLTSRPHAHARVTVCDVRGVVLRTLYDALLGTPTVRLRWNGRDARGLRVSAGVFLVTAEVEGERISEKLPLY